MVSSLDLFIGKAKAKWLRRLAAVSTRSRRPTGRPSAREDGAPSEVGIDRRLVPVERVWPTWRSCFSYNIARTVDIMPLAVTQVA